MVIRNKLVRIVVLNGLLFKCINSYDMFLNSLFLIGMMVMKVIVFVINNVIVDVRIIFKLLGI